MKAVIFDRDGVILDSESTNVESAVVAFKKLGVKITNKEKDYIIGKHPEDYTNYFLKKYKFPYEKFRALRREAYNKLLKSTLLFTETISLIKKLYNAGIPLAITTSAGLNSTLDVLKKAKLKNVFQVIVTFEDYEKRKPNPESYLLTAKKLGIKPKDCIVIEDSAVGVEAAKRAGMKCIALPNEYTKRQNLSKADIIVNSAKKINVDLLNNL